jgi:biopolymer transport protein ExbD
MPKASHFDLEAIAPDMTPMIDVTFQLIIFFMCINTMTELERMAQVRLPFAYQAIRVKDPGLTRMIVNIEYNETDPTVQGRIKIYNRPVTREQFKYLLHEYAKGLKAFQQKTGEAPIVVRGDYLCKYKDVKPVLEAIYDEGFTKIMFSSYMMTPGNRSKADAQIEAK